MLGEIIIVKQISSTCLFEITTYFTGQSSPASAEYVSTLKATQHKIFKIACVYFLCAVHTQTQHAFQDMEKNNFDIADDTSHVAPPVVYCFLDLETKAKLISSFNHHSHTRKNAKQSC